jgi:enoyl-CoA hydratase
MEMFMTGNSVNGVEAVRYGWANASFPLEQLEGEVLKLAEQITKLPLDVLQLNKRAIHRQMEAMGIRDGIRAGTELCALGTHTQSMANFVASIRDNGLTGALDRRDSQFGDYRTTDRADGLPTDAGQPDADKPSGSINYAS